MELTNLQKAALQNGLATVVPQAAGAVEIVLPAAVGQLYGQVRYPKILFTIEPPNLKNYVVAPTSKVKLRIDFQPEKTRYQAEHDIWTDMNRAAAPWLAQDVLIARDIATAPLKALFEPYWPQIEGSRLRQAARDSETLSQGNCDVKRIGSYQSPILDGAPCIAVQNGAAYILRALDGTLIINVVEADRNSVFISHVDGRSPEKNSAYSHGGETGNRQVIFAALADHHVQKYLAAYEDAMESAFVKMTQAQQHRLAAAEQTALNRQPLRRLAIKGRQVIEHIKAKPLLGFFQPKLRH